VHTPDLDDVFLALSGHSEKELVPMSTSPTPSADSTTMLRRQFLHMRRYPSMTLLLVAMPVVFLLLFVYVFGGTLGAGLGGGRGGAGRVRQLRHARDPAADRRQRATATADLGRHGHDRGHHRPVPDHGDLPPVGADRPRARQHDPDDAQPGGRPRGRPARRLPADATAVEWLAAAGVLAMIASRSTWLAVVCGLVSQERGDGEQPAHAAVSLPFLGSGFVPTESMPTALRWFAEYQPFTPVIETVRGLLLGTGIGHDAILAVAWSAGITVVCYGWAKALYNRDRTT
jgi:ABC-2 type transport system permease protein